MDIFGSFSTDSSLYNADIDVALTCSQTAEAEDRINMSELANHLSENVKLKSIEMIPTSSVPVMKLQHFTTGVRTDIVFTNDGVSVSKWLNTQYQLYPGTLRSLVLFLKFYLQIQNLNETYKGGCGSFLLSCLVLYFLQNYDASQSEHAERDSVTSMGVEATPGGESTTSKKSSKSEKKKKKKAKQAAEAVDETPTVAQQTDASPTGGAKNSLSLESVNLVTLLSDFLYYYLYRHDYATQIVVREVDSRGRDCRKQAKINEKKMADLW